MTRKKNKNKQAKAPATSTSPSSLPEEKVATQNLEGEKPSPMDDIRNRVKDPEHGEWFLANHGLMSLNFFLEDFCEKFIKQQHSCSRDALPNKSYETCPNEALCNNGMNYYDDRECMWKREPPCGVCDYWLNIILDAIKVTSPDYLMKSFKNCEVRKFPADDWQLAKACMMAGSQKCTSAQKTDISGLLAVFLNAKVFNFLGRDAMEAAKVVRNVRNEIIHAPKMKMTEENRHKLIGQMIAFFEAIEANIRNHNSELLLVGSLEVLRRELTILVELKKMDVKNIADLTDEKKYTEVQNFTYKQIDLQVQRLEASLSENSEKVEGIEKELQDLRELRQTFELFVCEKFQKLSEKVDDLHENHQDLREDHQSLRAEHQDLHEKHHALAARQKVHVTWNVAICVSDKKSIHLVINKEATKDVSHPPELIESHFDIALAFVEKDEGAAKKVIEILEKFVCFGDNESPKICPLNEYQILFHWIRSKPRSIDEVLQRSTFLFMIITDNFLTNDWAKHLIDDAVTRNIELPDYIVPVFQPSKSAVKQSIPYGLRHLHGLEVERFFDKRTRTESIENFDDKVFVQEDFCQYFIDSVSKMLAGKAQEKEMREKEQERKYREWKQKNESVAQQIEEMSLVDESIPTPTPASDSFPPCYKIDSEEQQLANEN
ncbi:hypothetical protein CAPTEDRAFT_206758 [Capitella teleta]|uniref:TIR domain-containing protein n=1 Tax=Capitella teleta TaxID=283909 RepID=R7U5P8_CAPTE|nr:hypothetical protein CAPTEDRAFT_206758 [Capitella teleta]|eukprot:ELU01411.1 hypothetical protein CAPTEDRAFT_206758 [Capitella teleta]